MTAMTTVGTVLLVWAGVLVLLVAALALGTRRRGKPERNDVPARTSRGDRRTGRSDRRIGMPDLRTHPVERRRGQPDRRAGAVDRRRILGPA